jgi:plastocyanin
MAFGGNTQVRSGQTSPTGDALIAFALPQAGGGGPNMVTAQPTPLAKGGIPDSGLQPIAKTPPAGAQVIEMIETHDIHFYPERFTAQPGQQVAVHLKNVEPNQVQHNFAIALPSGWVGMQGTIGAGEEGYFVFTAPMEPGDYGFWCDVGTHRFQGMIGTLTVAAAGGTPGMPRTGAGPDPALSLGMALLAVALLTLGVFVSARRRAA